MRTKADHEWYDETWDPSSIASLHEPLRWRVPRRRVLVGSTNDIFHPSNANEFIATVFAIISAYHQHHFAIVTSYPERIAAFLNWIVDPQGGARGYSWSTLNVRETP